MYVQKLIISPKFNNGNMGYLATRLQCTQFYVERRPAMHTERDDGNAEQRLFN